MAPGVTAGAPDFRQRPVDVHTMVTWRASVAVVLTLSGCTTTWSRPATSATEFVRDNHVCQHMNTQAVSIGPSAVREYVAMSGYKQCMQDEGYTEGGPWPGSAGWRQ